LKNILSLSVLCIAGFIFPDEKFDKGIGYDTSYENTFQMDRRSPELLKRGAFKMESFGFEDLLPAKWYLLAVFEHTSYLPLFLTMIFFSLKIVVVYDSVGLHQQLGKISTWAVQLASIDHHFLYNSPFLEVFIEHQ
jgi:hypothetical protein